MSRRDWRRSGEYEPETRTVALPAPVDFLAAQQFRPYKRRRKGGNTPETLPARLDSVCAWLDSEP